MKCIVLAAGKDKNSIEKSPKCLRMVNNKTVLDNFVDILDNKYISNINLVGGFGILQIMEKYPDLNYFYNEKWRDTKSLYSLSKAFKAFDNNSLISYSDIIHKSETLKLINQDKINIFYDSLWETRYENRDLNNLERVLDSKGRMIGEFSGLLHIPKKEVNRIKSLIKDLLEKDIKSTLLDLINSIVKDNSVSFIDVSGKWAELDSVQDMMHFKFGTKAETLNNLKLKLKKSQVLEQYTFTVGQYTKDQKTIIQNIQNNLSSKLLVVRSSALNEDTESSSLAGNYESILKVEKDNVDILINAIEVVKESYRKNGQVQDKNNQILIQPYLEKVTMSGVVFSKNLQTSSPYYTVNYDMSENTESVTSGNGGNLNTFICYNNFTGQIQNERLSMLINSIKEIENVTKYDAIDVEFAFVDMQLYILQVRPIAAKKESVMVSSENVLSEINNIKDVLDIESINLLGSKKAYGVMPDWNPAEIIGINPKKLSFDLYCYLITDNVWAQSRALLGYKNINSAGLISLGGKPYVDIQMSFNTFIPDELPDDLSAKLVNYFIWKLERHPQNHDKVEFLVVITAYDFTFDEKVKDLLDNGFSEIECEKILEAYKNLTQNIITGQTLSIEEEIDKTLSLARRRKKVLSSNVDDISKIYYLLEDCKQYGTLPFANLARCGFIGSILLKSLLEKDSIKVFEYDEFFKSIHTVAKEFMDDFILLSRKQLSKESFIDRYGHLRPGTYDITSKSYENGFNDYIDFNVDANNSIADNKFKFSKDTKEKINREILKSNLNFDVETLLQFIIKSTEAREQSKFEFTKNLSVVLDLITTIGQEFGLSANDLSHLDLNTLLKYRNASSRLNLGDEIVGSIEKNKNNYLVTCSLNLPELIFNKIDVEMFHYLVMMPNFITHHNITAGAVFLTAGNYKNIDNKIVCIENADPGFDWIFSHNIKGLITKYGGIASHMSIRCAEFDLPAAIGCGNKIFNSLVTCNKVNLDCANKKIRGI
jgi:choline kinase